MTPAPPGARTLLPLSGACIVVVAWGTSGEGAE